MKKISLALSLALLLIVVFAFNVFAATTNNIENDARFEQNGSKSDLLDLSKVIDNDYYTGSSCGNDGENWVNYRFYYDEGTIVSKVRVVLNSTGTLSNGKVYESVSTNSYEFYVRLYDKFENTVFNTKYKSIENATEVKDADGNVLYTYFEIVFEKPYTDVYMVEVPVVNNKNADVGLWEVEIYDYVCDDDEHEWVGTLCGEHCDVCGQVKDPTLACEAEEDDGDCRTAVLCKYCDSVMVASQKHVFAEGETVCSNDGCVFEGKNIVKDTSITPVDVSENSYGENGEFMNWWYYSAHITDGKYNTIAHSNYFGQYKFTFNIKNPTVLSEIFIVSNSSGIYHPWGYTHDNLAKDFKVKVVIYDASGNVISTTEYQSLDFTNPNVVPIYAESGEMTSVGYKLDTNYANASKIELFINEGVWEVEIYEHVTCDYQFVETVAPGCTTEGYDLYACACGNKKYENTVAALGHNYDDGVVTKEAGEEEDGEILYTCATCGGTKTLAIPATGHEHNYDTYVGNSVEPTCAVVGSATYVCRCGDTTEVEIPATGKHNYNVFVEYTTEPTYLKDGFADYKCATCDGTISVNVGRLQMNTAKYAEGKLELGGWTANGVKYLIDGNYNVGCAGSHSTNGWAFSLNYGEDYTFTKLAFVVNSVGSHPVPPFSYTSKTTKNYSFAITLYDANGNAVWTKSTTCADGVEMTGIDANGNEFLYDVVTIELDEAVVASKLYVKINSGWDNGAGMWEVETYGLPVNYHEVHDFTKLIEKYSDPTCTEAGSALYRCSKCETTSVVETPATGHSYFYDCDKVCQVCGEVSNPDATHTLVHVDAKAATCFENGNIEYWYCEACGYAWLDADCTLNTNLKAVVLPMAHGTITHVEAKAATCFEDGNIEYWYCEACGYAWLDADCTLNTNLKAVVLPAGHQWSETPEDVVAATCISKGTGKYFCVNCWAYDEETGEVETPINPENHPNIEFTNELYNFAVCPDCDAFSFYGMHNGVGDNDLTWYFMGDVINIYNDDYTIDECYKATVAYNEETGVYTFTLSAVSEEDYGYATTYVGCTATLVINENGTFMITLAVSEDSALVFGKDPNVIEPENDLLNGVYAYYNMAEELMIKLEFDNGTIYVLEDNMGAGFPESFAYNYYPATGVIDTPDVAFANFSVSDGQIYFGRGFALVEVEEEPEIPDVPEIDYGSIIGSFVVETTDTYCYIDLYSYTAEKAGQYAFYIPADHGFYSVASYEAWGEAEVGFYFNPNGDYAVFDLAAGETIEFYVGGFEKETWTIEVYYYTEAHVHTEEIIPAILPTPSVVGYTAGVKCSECDEIIVAPVEITVTDISSADFKFKSASLTLAENISVNYKAVVNGDYSNIYVVFLFDGYEFVVTDYTIEDDTGLLVFNFAETRPQLMASNITAYIYGVDADGNYVRNVQGDYSVMKYCSNQLKKYKDNEEKAGYYTMICDVLALGTATQLYMNKNVDALVTDLVAAQGYEIKSTTFAGIDASWNKQALTGDRTQGADWKSANLTLGGSTEMNLKFEADSVEGLVVKIDIDGLEYYYDAEDFTMDGNRYVVTLTQITALQFDQVVIATFEKDGVQFGSTLEYSIGTYLQKNCTKTDAQGNLIKALYNYGMSVYNEYGQN